MKYKRAGVIGKFHNYHQGHFELIKYALTLAPAVTVLLCQEDDDLVETWKRVDWMKADFGSRISVEVVQPSAHNLSNKSESDEQVSKEWAEFIDDVYPEIDVFVGSEDYITYCANYGNFDGVIYDIERKITPCSSTQVREKNQHEFYSPAARESRVTRIAFIGPESTGKTFVGEYLAEANGYELITEAARDMMSDTHYTMQDLDEFAAQQNLDIVKSGKKSDVVIVDSSSVTTAMYSKQTFGRVSNTVGSLAAFEKIDAYVLFAPNCDFVQDGTRVQTQEQRVQWYENAVDYLERLGKPVMYVRKGNDWTERANEALSAVTMLVNKVAKK